MFDLDNRFQGIPSTTHTPRTDTSTLPLAELAQYPPAYHFDKANPVSANPDFRHCRKASAWHVRPGYVAAFP